MVACEWCWAKATLLAAVRNESVVACYDAVLGEQVRLGESAECPQAREHAVRTQ